MRIIEKNTFNFGPNFYNWMTKYDHLPLVRSYCGRAHYRNLYLLLQVYDPSNVTKGYIDRLILWEKEIGTQAKLPLVQERETLLAVVGVLNDNNSNGFLMDNYLDTVGVRTHYILDGGGGKFTCIDNSQSVDYKAGDLLVFENNDFNKRWIHEAKPGHQIVTCWSNLASTKRNWELFAEYENRYNIGAAR
jgi:hypothetical protein